jgi:hypothetical protein
VSLTLVCGRVGDRGRRPGMGTTVVRCTGCRCRLWVSALGRHLLRRGIGRPLCPACAVAAAALAAAGRWPS